MKQYSLNEVMQKFVKTTIEWKKTIRVMLQRLNEENGKWWWPNAGLIFTRVSQDSYIVEKV